MCTQYSPVARGISHTPRPALARVPRWWRAGRPACARAPDEVGLRAAWPEGVFLVLPPMHGRGYGFDYRRAVPDTPRAFPPFPSPYVGLLAGVAKWGGHA